MTFAEHATFRDLIAANKRNTGLLMAVMILFTFVVAMLLALAILLYVAPDAVSQVNWTEAVVIGLIAAGVAFLISLLAYYRGDQLVLGVAGAHPIQHSDDPELFNVVEEMAIAAGVPMPKIYIIDDPALSAFATGRDPQHATVAITRGLRRRLTRDELQGVIGHEMSHVRNYDIRLMLMMAVMIGTIVMLCDVFWQVLWFGPRRGRSSDRDRGGGGMIMLVLLLLALVLAAVAPLLAQIIQLAVSRQREYLADASSVELTRNPLGLIHALQKLENDPHELRHANRGIAHLFISNPIERYQMRAHSAFASHPPLEDRIARLRALLRNKNV
jgi:heat shock protein HtpX